MLLNKKILFIILLLLFQLCAIAIDDTILPQTDLKEIKLTAKITFDDILEKAKTHSYDLKIADYETLIAKTGIISARSEYFPKFFANAGTDYSKSFNDNANQVPTYVGDSYINPYTRYQSVIGISLAYNLFDFGLRKNRLDIAKVDVAAKELEEKNVLQELELSLVDIYTKILISKKQIDNANQVLALQNQNLEYTKRLYDAKEASKTELDNINVETLQTQKQIKELKQILAENLSWLAFYTGESYDIDNLKAADIKKEEFNPAGYLDYTKTLVWKIYDSELKKKDLELKMAKKNNYPKVGIYGKYYIYGSDYSSFNDAISDMEPSNFSIGANASMPLFDGFQNSANIKKTLLELQQLNIKRDKAIAEWMTRIAALKSNYLYMNATITKNEQILARLQEKEKSSKRLAAKKIITPLELNNAKIELLKEENELNKNQTTLVSVLKGIEILTRNRE